MARRPPHLASRLTARPARQRCGARVVVRDRGPGVDPASLADIFKPFWRARSDEPAPSDGAGLGLAIADRIVRMHDGRISALNTEPDGLAVAIELPNLG